MSVDTDLATLHDLLLTPPGRVGVTQGQDAYEALGRVEAELSRLDRIVSGHISRADRREGMVVAYDYDGEYVGCIGAHTWRWLLESGVTEEQLSRLTQERDVLLEASPFPVETVMSWKRQVDDAKRRSASALLLLDREHQDENTRRAFEILSGLRPSTHRPDRERAEAAERELAEAEALVAVARAAEEKARYGHARGCPVLDIGGDCTCGQWELERALAVLSRPEPTDKEPA